MEITVTVEDILYPRDGDKGGWFVLDTDHGKCVGTIDWRPQPKKQLTLNGQWGAYKGERNFKFKTARPQVPSDSREMLHLACSLTDGIGDTMEEAIWDFIGDKWEHIKAGDIPRFTDSISEKFQLSIEKIKDDRAHAEAICWLLSIGCSDKFANAAYDHFKRDVIAIINNDCYKLADVKGYGFQDIDRKIRFYFSISDDDERRIRTVIKYSLKSLVDSGNTIIGWPMLCADAIARVGPEYGALISDQTRQLFEIGELHKFPEIQSVSFEEDYQNEVAIWQYATQH